MSQRLTLQVAGPALLIGLLLFGASLVAVWSIQRVQGSLSALLSDNVTSLEAAQDLEVQLRQVRLHSLLYVLGPTDERWERIEEDNRLFEEALAVARATAHLPGERALVEAIEEGYRQYRGELQRARAEAAGLQSRADFLRWADDHPVRGLVAPCHELLRLNKEAMDRVARESETVSRWTRAGMLGLGLAGPAAGLVAGFGITRGLTRSIAQLRVRLEDVGAHLEREVGPFRLAAAADLADLDRVLQSVVERVREVVGQMQRQREEIVRAEQLAAVGQLAAGIAHEIRNPLTAVKMLVGAALYQPDQRGLMPEDLAVIHSEIERVERTVQNLLDFARPAEPRREPCDLRQSVARALELTRPRAEQLGVTVEVCQPDEPVVAPADPDQMGTVLVNLLLNALDAMPRGGRLRVALERDPGEVRLTVEDTGAGIPPEMAGRLFTPFASSKATGTGLGLSICRRVLRDHGGDITARNRAEGGACFTAVLPTRE